MITIQADWSAVIPAEDRILGYTGENGVEQREFLLPPGYEDWIVRLDLRLADGSTDIVLPDRAPGGGDTLIWTIQNRHLARAAGKGGTIALQCRAEKADQVKKSAVMLFEAGPSLKAVSADPANPSEIRQAEQQMNALLAEGQRARDGAQSAKTAAAASAEAATAEADRAQAIDAYTKNAAADLFAAALRGTASGVVARLENVSGRGALRRAAVLGATIETGAGEKGPDNPFAMSGAESRQLTACGQNIVPMVFSETWAPYCSVGADGSVTCSNSTGNMVYPKTVYIRIPNGTYRCYREDVGDVDEGVRAYFVQEKPGDTYDYRFCQLFTPKSQVVTVTKGGILCAFTINPGSSGTIRLWMTPGDETYPYTPYVGQIYPLPALAPLYGDGAINDEYDAATGLETRRWGRIVLDGTENWKINRDMFRWSPPVTIPAACTASQINGLCTHFPSQKGNDLYEHTHYGFAIFTNYSAYVFIDFRIEGMTEAPVLSDFTSWLAAQYAAGTPVTVLYRLRDPLVIRHDPTRILPPAPVCNVYAGGTGSTDAGSVEVAYNRDMTAVIDKLESRLEVRRT